MSPHPLINRLDRWWSPVWRGALAAAVLAVIVLSAAGFGHVPASLTVLQGSPTVWELPAVNASGIAWQGNRQRLWVVQNNPEVALALSATGDVTHRVPLHGFHDTEELVWLYGNTFAVTEERRCRVTVFQLHERLQRVRYADAEWHGVPGACRTDNKGLEGLAYDHEADRLYLAQEAEPRRIWFMDQVSSDAGPRPARLFLDEPHTVSLGADLSGLAVHPNGRLLVLSDESRRVTALSAGANTLGSVSVFDWGAGPAQPEGVVFDDSGAAYVVSEPNRVFRYPRESFFTVVPASRHMRRHPL